MSRWAKLTLVYASFTAWVISWRWSSMPSRADWAFFLAASVAAMLLPKSKRSCDIVTWAAKFSPKSRLVLDARLLTMMGLVIVWEVELPMILLLRVANTLPVSWGSSGESAWLTL